MGVDVHRADVGVADCVLDVHVLDGERAVPRLATVEGQRFAALAADVHQLGHARLHPERHLVLRDARLDFRVAERVEVPLQRRDLALGDEPRTEVCRGTSARTIGPVSACGFQASGSLSRRWLPQFDLVALGIHDPAKLPVLGIVDLLEDVTAFLS